LGIEEGILENQTADISRSKLKMSPCMSVLAASTKD